MADFSAVGKRSRSKGNKFERDLARYLTERLGDIPEWGNVVTARSLSGGRQLGEDFLRKTADSTGALLPYYIDAKNWNTFQPEKWIEDVKQDEMGGRDWVIVYHPDRAQMGRNLVIFEIAPDRWVMEWLDNWIEYVRAEYESNN